MSMTTVTINELNDSSPTSGENGGGWRQSVERLTKPKLQGAHHGTGDVVGAVGAANGWQKRPCLGSEYKNKKQRQFRTSEGGKGATLHEKGWHRLCSLHGGVETCPYVGKVM